MCFMAATEGALVRVSVVYASPDRVIEIETMVGAGASLRDVIVGTGILTQAPELDLASLDVGVFNHPRQLDSSARDGDRIEIYRPLLIDPKEARRVRAATRRRQKGA